MPATFPFDAPKRGVTTNTAASAGYVGELISDASNNLTATVTITIASPGVVTWTAHGFSAVNPTPIQFTTTGALPTGLAINTTYYTIPSTVTTDTFQLATSVANALAGTFIATSVSQSGTHTGLNSASLSTGAATNVSSISLTPGHWQLVGFGSFGGAATTTVSTLFSQVATSPTATRTSPFGTGQVSWVTGQAVLNGNNVILPTSPFDVLISATTRYYLDVIAVFGTSTAFAYGGIEATRIS